MIFSELRSDAEILKDAVAARRIFVIGCPACASISLNIQQPTKNSAAYELTQSGYRAVAMEEEVERLAMMLYGTGFDVGSWVGKFPMVGLCILNEGLCKKITRGCHDFDTVITMSCDTGRKSIEGILPDKNVIPGMLATGLVNAMTTSKMKFLKHSIDNDSVHLSECTFDAEN